MVEHLLPAIFAAFLASVPQIICPPIHQLLMLMFCVCVVYVIVFPFLFMFFWVILLDLSLSVHPCNGV